MESASAMEASNVDTQASALEANESQIMSSEAERVDENASSNTSESQAQEPTKDELELYQAIESYDWEHDNVYQRALEHMSKTSQVEPNELELRAKGFYWERKFKTKVDLSKYRSWKMAEPAQPNDHIAATISSLTTNLNHSSITDDTSSATTSRAPSMHDETSEVDETPYPQNFAEVAELITSGRSHLLPGIRKIPQTVLADKITPPTKELRKKPWEKDGAEVPTGGMFGDRRDVFIKQE